MRKSGILMPVSSLPSNHGIGDFGENAYEFVRLIKKSGFKIWQILPLNALGYGNSPYQPYSSKAMDELYISLDLLVKDGLLEEVEVFRKDSDVVDYDAVREFKRKYLMQAFQKFERNQEFEDFSKLEWVYHYAMFITFKKLNGMKCWNEWGSEYKNYFKNKLVEVDEESINYEIFIQFILLKQWKALRNYVNQLDIEIMGDMPFYVGLDSDDVWIHQEDFLLDEKGVPTVVAGVPPDYFSEDGQRWGNPIYNWEKLEKDGFAFWLERLDYSSKLFDIVRIDHFRAFDTYWQIKGECPTAREGEWLEAPGHKVFETIYKTYPDIKIVAEDLGEMREEVYELRDAFNLKGMRIIQYSWHLPKMKKDRNNLIIYTGTHDNEPIRSWYNNLSKEDKLLSRKYFRRHNLKQAIIADSFIQYALESNADIAIISMVDILNKKIDCRLNTPGTVGNPNWQWRLNDYSEFKKRVHKLQRMIKESNR